MHFLKRAAVAAILAVGIVGAGSGSAQAADGCVGFPNYGGLYYHCMEANSHLPRVDTTGTTTVGQTIPAFCYFLGCTSELPVSYTVPVKISTVRPSPEVTVFALEYSCYEYYWYGRYCAQTYEIVYYGGTNCEFRTTDSTLSAVNGQRFRCQV